jgi:hypothetical protein
MPVARRNGWHPRATVEHVEAVRTWVYCAHDGTALKIGKSRHDPAHRLHDLSTGNPRPLVLLAKSGHVTERQMHRRAWVHHVRAEWFTLCPDVLRLLADWDWCDQAAVRRLLEVVAACRRPRA